MQAGGKRRKWGEYPSPPPPPNQKDAVRKNPEVCNAPLLEKSRSSAGGLLGGQMANPNTSPPLDPTRTEEEKDSGGEDLLPPWGASYNPQSGNHKRLADRQGLGEKIVQRKEQVLRPKVQKKDAKSSPLTCILWTSHLIQSDHTHRR